MLNFVPLTGRKTQRFAGSLIPDAESGAPEENSLDISPGQADSVSAAACVDLFDNPRLTRLVDFEILGSLRIMPVHVNV